LLRIPYTFNSKSIENSEVNVIQRFDDTFAAIPHVDANLLREFRLYLADLDIKNKLEAAKEERVIIQKMKNYQQKDFMLF
jgi:hypothetical protein